MSTLLDDVRAIEHAAHSVTGASGDYDALLDLVGRPALRAHRRGVARHARVLPGAGPHHPPPDRRARVHRGRGRGRLARRVPRQSLRAWACRTISTPTSRSPTSAASRRGCGATATCCSSSSGCARATTRTRIRRRKARFYGLDLYSLQASIEAVIDYLDRVDPAEAAPGPRPLQLLRPRRRARARPTGTRSRTSARSRARTRSSRSSSTLRRRAEAYLRRDGWVAEDELFFAEQNARVVRDAEEYYQQMYRAEVSSWNLRDRHMAGTLDALVEHLDRRLGRAKVVVWEHNSHVGDARATAMGARGELNVGQLARQRYGNECLLVGFTTYDGAVTAASDWGDAAERKRVRPALPGQPRGAAARRRGARASGSTPGDPPLASALRAHAARAGDRRHLPARDRAAEPLLRRPHRRPVRRGDPLRPHPRARAARAHVGLGPRRAAGDLPDRDLRCSTNRTRCRSPARRPGSPAAVAARPLVVLGLARGGVPVAYEVADALGAPLDVIVVRKLGVPSQPELAMGAIGEDGVRVLNREVVARGPRDRGRVRRGRGPGTASSSSAASRASAAAGAALARRAAP